MQAKYPKNLYELICIIHEEGEVSKDFHISRLVMIPEEVGANKCEDYKLIGSHTMYQRF